MLKGNKASLTHMCFILHENLHAPEYPPGINKVHLNLNHVHHDGEQGLETKQCADTIHLDTITLISSGPL